MTKIIPQSVANAGQIMISSITADDGYGNCIYITSPSTFESRINAGWPVWFSDYDSGVYEGVH